MAYFRTGTARATHAAQKIAVAKTPLATFSGNVSGLNLAETIAYIVATQSGSGTPSPTNPRSIVGVTQVDTTVCGKNLFNDTNVINAYFNTSGVVKASGNTRLVYSRCKANTTYTVSKTAGQRYAVAYSDDIPVAELQCSGYTSNNTASSITITTGANAKYICAYVYHSSYDSGTARDMLDSVQIEEGSATPYEAYNGTTATTALPTTCYGGYLYVNDGWLVRTHGYIASYNGETINEPWISSLDPYVAGNTPTTGAQVVYPLTTPTTEQLTPHQIEQLLGQNNVFASSGDVAVKYWKID